MLLNSHYKDLVIFIRTDSAGYLGDLFNLFNIPLVHMEYGNR
jgi:hypothetical protein